MGNVLIMVILLLLTGAFTAVCRALLSPQDGKQERHIEVNAPDSANVSVTHNDDDTFAVEVDYDLKDLDTLEPSSLDEDLIPDPELWEEVARMPFIKDRDHRIRIGRTLLHYNMLKMEDLMTFVDRFWQTSDDDDSLPPGAPVETPAPRKPDPIPDRRVINFDEISAFAEDEFQAFYV